MEFKLHSHRNALEIVNSTPELTVLWNELTWAIESISDDRLLDDYQARVLAKSKLNDSPPKSLSYSINDLLDFELVREGWQRQTALFSEKPYTSKNEKRWRLDFSKSVKLSEDSARRIQTSKEQTGFAVEVAFNHGEAIAWNLLKPVMASELNHVAKAVDIGEGLGVLISASSELKKKGGFDSAVGEFEKVLRYLNPMRDQLKTPMLILGLEAPKTFRLEKLKGRKPSRVVMVS